MEEGKVVEWEAPCHQYALFMPEDGSGSDTNSCQFGTDQTERDGKNNWMVAELEKDQVHQLSYSSHQEQNLTNIVLTIAVGVCDVLLEVCREGGQRNVGESGRKTKV